MVCGGLFRGKLSLQSYIKKMKKIIFVFSLLIIVYFCFVAGSAEVRAVTIDEIRAQIAQLSAQIAALQLQLAQMQGGTTWCHTFNVNLGIGSTGAEVDALWTALTKDGAGPELSYDHEGMGQVSKFGEYTASAVVAFQEKYGSEILTPWGLKHGTGYVGKTTRAKLNKLYGCDNGLPCLQEGQASYRCTGSSGVCTGAVYPTQYCCSGLSKVSYSYLNANNQCYTGEGFTCTYCGNGVCGKGENQCNCPTDCAVNKSISVTSPNGDGATYIENITAGQNVYITWNSQGVSKVKISVCGETPLLSTKYTCWELPGMGYGVDASLGKYNWYVDPNAIYIPGRMKVRIADLSNSNLYDESDNYFSIVASTAKRVPPCLSYGDVDNNGYVEKADSDLVLKIVAGLIQATDWQKKYADVSGDGAIEAYDPALIQQYVVGTIYSFAACNVSQKSISVVSPNGGEEWLVGYTYAIKWDSSGFSPNDKIQIGLRDKRSDPNLGTGEATIANTSNSGIYYWTIPAQISPMVLGGNNIYSIVLYVNGGGDNQFDSSDNYFSIIAKATAACTDSDGGLNYYTKGYIIENGRTTWDVCATSTASPNTLWERACTGSMFYDCSYGCENGACKKRVTLISPNGGEIWQAGNTVNIEWQANGINKIRISLDNVSIGQVGFSYDVATSVDATLGKYSWALSKNFLVDNPYFKSGKNFKIRLYDTTDSAIRDESDDFFTINGATSFNCTDSDGGQNYEVQGNTEGFGNSTNPVVSKVTDFCIDQNSLTEYYCSNTTYWTKTVYYCPYGCENGACNKQPLKTFTYNLQKGWNTISLPIQPKDSSLKSFLGQLSNVVNYTFGAYDSINQNFKYVAVKNSATNYINNLTLDVSQDYMLYVDQPASIIIQGSSINQSIGDWAQSVRTNAFRYLVGNIGENKNMFLAGFPFLSSTNPKAINDALAQIVPYSSLGWFKFNNATQGWDLLYWPLSTTSSNMYSPLEPGRGYLAVEAIDCQKKYGADYFCGSSADLVNKCNGKGTSYAINDTNPAAFCGSNNNQHCLKCDPYQATKIGNPGLAQFPNNDSNDRLARGVRDLQVYQGKIYVGDGDLANNRGPIKVWSFADSQNPTSFQADYTVDEEEVTRLRAYNNKLYIPGADATESWDFSSFYVKENGVWTKKRTIPGALHVMDIAEANGKLCVLDYSTPRPGYSFGSHALVSSDNGNSWTVINHQYNTPDYYTLAFNLLPWNGRFLSVISAYKYSTTTGLGSFVGGGLAQSNEVGDYFSIGYKFSPKIIFQGKIMGSCSPQRQCFTSDLQNFTYIDGFSDPTHLDEVSLAKVLIDQVVVGDTIYVLTQENPIINQTKTSFKFYSGGIYSSKDLINWTKEGIFDFPAMPTAFEYLNGAFYVGLSSNYDADTKTYIDDEAGSIYKISR